MSEQALAVGMGGIVVGEPLPFSVFSADGKLLLAKGEVVESDRMYDMLVRNGRREDGQSLAGSPDDTGQAEPAYVEDGFSIYTHDFNKASGQARIGARLSREESGDNYPCWMLGADDVHGLIVTAPCKPDRSLLPIAEGQSWVFRLLYLTAVCKFTATIRKVHFDPVPMLNVSPPRQVEMRLIRTSPRVASCVRGTINVGKEVPVMITDIGIGGVCLAVDRSHVELRAGQRITVSFCIPMLGVNYNFKVPATVISSKQDFDKRYPTLQFVGAKIEAQSEMERLVLHSYVYERTATDLNALWKTMMENKV
jgi:hypothetical protein